ncbi:TetR/AcrR family transcriptional regulator [Glycomyces buryatensis]|uniref:TetR/AcrR family transcriptional regulator n=1 Tax=Glycomyces buryatensis TaxID=2570927 RepID=A0A4S8PQZ0_9ACTN|nr:TetR/AcrR family transcriptional regulator [Glycomyces buryatensis]THV33610.1 TetR/AcrR family transcriptional regulator [Glycomyces buryatensis]
MGTKQARGKETVARLLDAAMEVYGERGPEGFTMTAVIERSGVSVGSLYHHFGSFSGLAAALYARSTAELTAELAAAVRSKRTARTGIQALVTAYLRWCVDNRDQAHFMLALPYLGTLSSHVDQVMAANAADYSAINAWVLPHVEAGRIRPMPQNLLECLIIGPITETVTRWLIRMPGADIEPAFKVLPERIWESVRGPAA